MTTWYIYTHNCHIKLKLSTHRQNYIFDIGHESETFIGEETLQLIKSKLSVFIYKKILLNKSSEFLYIYKKKMWIFEA